MFCICPTVSSIFRQIYHKLLFLSFILPVLFYMTGGDKAFAAAAVDKEVKQQVEVVAKPKKENSEETLLALLKLKKSLQNRIDSREKQLKKEKSSHDQQRLKDEIKVIEKQLSGVYADFERIATGIEEAVFVEKRQDIFSWKDELASLLKPAFAELKQVTVKARARTDVMESLDHYQELQPVARDALKQLESLIASSKNAELKKELKALVPEWKDINNQITSKLKVANLKLEEFDSDTISVVDTLGRSTADFFRKRGLYLGIALIVFFTVLFACRILYRLIVTYVPLYTGKQRSFMVRFSEIILNMSGYILAAASVFIVFYIVEDWTLLSLLIVVSVGTLLSVRQVIPKIMGEMQLMLNIGSVREGERLSFLGVSWRVKRMHIFAQLENPDLGIIIRLPVHNLIGICSRPFAGDEPWFPCRKNDWVILSDGVRGKVVSLSHEMVCLVERGGSRKTYQTADFLALAPRNLSITFRIKEVFGVSYALQGQISSEVAQTMEKYIREQFVNDGFAKTLIALQVNLQQAGASSLDLVVIADFNGEAAPLYGRIRRMIQRYCVEVCTLNDWEIPFPQLTLHQEK